MSFTQPAERLAPFDAATADPGALADELRQVLATTPDHDVVFDAFYGQVELTRVHPGDPDSDPQVRVLLTAKQPVLDEGQGRAAERQIEELAGRVAPPPHDRWAVSPRL